VPGHSFALVCLALGEIDFGLDWLEKAVEERDSPLTVIIHSPTLDPLRSYPRYHAAQMADLLRFPDC
jgi:hypothetical protein